MSLLTAITVMFVATALGIVLLFLGLMAAIAYIETHEDGSADAASGASPSVSGDGVEAGDRQ